MTAENSNDEYKAVIRQQIEVCKAFQAKCDIRDAETFLALSRHIASLAEDMDKEAPVSIRQTDNDTEDDMF